MWPRAAASATLPTLSAGPSAELPAAALSLASQFPARRRRFRPNAAAPRSALALGHAPGAAAVLAALVAAATTCLPWSPASRISVLTRRRVQLLAAALPSCMLAARVLDRVGVRVILSVGRRLVVAVGLRLTSSDPTGPCYSTCYSPPPPTRRPAFSY